MAKKIRTKSISFDMPHEVDSPDPQKWSNQDVEYVVEQVITRFGKHNPIESLNLLPSSSYYRLNFKLEYVAKDSSATRFGNIQRIRQQLLMECL
jgi:hypothetical protein